MSDDRFVGFDPKGGRLPLAAFVENVDADTVRVYAAPGYELAVFKAPGHAFEVAVVGDDDTWRLRIKQPAANQSITITHPEPRVIQFRYEVIG